MQIAGIQKTTLVDYPGKVAATVFLRGCNFRCGFCHNPELVLPEQFLPVIDKNEFFRFLESRIGKLKGVCITGGEPLLWETTRSLVSHIKALGFAVKLDTNGSFPDRLETIIKDGDLDYIAMDIKAPLSNYERVANNQLPMINPQINSKFQSNNLQTLIKSSINLIMSSGIDYEFRTTVAKPYHKPGDFVEIGKIIKGAQKFYIQNFVQSKHLLGNINFEPFTQKELNQALKNVSGYVEVAAIR
ncbi:MAG: molybdenum cofactor biosynthesis protein A [bacterium ADurb.Bin212]|nr:MAG: molybdenum cofactor biosynthesis protein A [bacterium ADurb.Bin212]